MGYSNEQRYFQEKGYRMKKISLILFLIIIIGLFSACTQQEEPSEITAKVIDTPSCPRGLTSDPAPGICHLYVDENFNNVCDLSE